jgi:hypothetical protein
MQKKTIAEPKWIKLINLNAGGVPCHAHPDESQLPLWLSGSFSVRWPNGSVSQSEIKTSMASIHGQDLPNNPTTYTYFEAQLNGISLIYDLHEVELLSDEVVRFLKKPKLAKAG